MESIDIINEYIIKGDNADTYLDFSKVFDTVPQYDIVLRVYIFYVKSFFFSFFFKGWCEKRVKHGDA